MLGGDEDAQIPFMDVGDPFPGLFLVFLKSTLNVSLFNAVCMILLADENSTLRKFPDEEWKPFAQLFPKLVLVYRVAVFDAYLNSISSYAYARHPSEATNNTQIATSRLISRKSHEIINEYIAKRTKILSREDFRTRIENIEKIMGVKFNISKEEYDELKEISKLRNEIVHEGGSYTFTIDDLIAISNKSNENAKISPIPPKVLDTIARKIYLYSVRDYIKRDLHKNEKDVLLTLETLNKPKPNSSA